MKLYYAPTSPFARKVRIAIYELGIESLVEFVQTDPWTSAELRQLNPLGKVPTFVCGSEQPLFESGLICEYLNQYADGELFPKPGAPRWNVLRRQAVADGVSASAGRLFADERRAANERAASVMERQRQAIDMGLDALERDVAALSDQLADIGSIAVASSLQYLDFRWPDRDWSVTRPALRGWLNDIAQRPSLVQTAYHTIRA